MKTENLALLTKITPDCTIFEKDGRTFVRFPDVRKKNILQEKLYLLDFVFFSVDGDNLVLQISDRYIHPVKLTNLD